MQTRGLISLVDDNHLDNNLNEILVYVYCASIDPKGNKLMPNSADPDQKPLYVTSDLGLHSLLMSVCLNALLV